MARRFTRASSELIEFSLGSMGFTGDISFACVVKMEGNDAAAQTFFACGSSTSGNNRWLVARDTANKVSFQEGGSAVTSTTTVTVASGWVMLGVSKASGTNTPRCHFYNYGTGTVTHENSSGTLANHTAPSVSNRIGRAYAATNFLDADVVMVGAWNANLTDLQFEWLALTMQGWWAQNPAGLWVLDQGATTMLVNDLTGNGANQSSITGTSVSAVSPLGPNYGHRPTQKA